MPKGYGTSLRSRSRLNNQRQCSDEATSCQSATSFPGISVRAWRECRSASATLGRRLLLVALAATLPVACMSPNPLLYTLAVVPGPEHAGAPHVIELRAIAVAHYLERSQIVRSSEDFRLDVLGNEWWGEPLDAMLGRVLSQELTQRLPGSTVYGENGSISAQAGATVAINVQRLDENAAGAVVLIAQVAVASGRDNVTRTVRYTVPPAGASTPGLVSAMSVAVGQLADTVAGMIVAR
jgi:uncharacterized protein